MDSTTEFKLGELFCGPGGLAYGAITASIDDDRYRIVHTWANDYDESTCETYRHNICPDNPQSVICEDVHCLDINQLDSIDCLAFGFPCNDFSMIGEKRGFDGEYGPLYTYGIKALEIHRPMWFVAENVGGIQSSDGGSAFEKILDDMKSVGYRIYPHMYKFEDYGIPQSRHRIIIVGIRDDLPYEFKIPAPTFEIKTCRQAIEIPPIPKDAKNNELTRQSELVIRRLSYIKPGENVFTAEMPDELRLKVKGATISQLYRRLDPDKPSYTVIGRGGGGMHVYHWSEPRSLTNRERARLQTFPDEFVFFGNKTQVRSQIGMAVPVDGARIIFEAILKTFAEIPYEYVDRNIKD